MAWIISAALMRDYESLHCLQGLAEESLVGSCSDGEQCAPLSGSLTQLAYLSQGKMTEFSRLSRFGMTFKPLMGILGEELLTWYRGGSLVRTYRQPEKAQELTGPGPQCGGTWLESSARFDRVSCSWKIHRSLFDEDLLSSSVTLPRWGMMLDGVVYQRGNAVRITNVTGYGLLLPTPTCHNAKEGDYPAERERNTPLLATHVGGKIHPHYTEWMMGWPQDHTDLKPLETVKSQYVPPLPFQSLQMDGDL